MLLLNVIGRESALDTVKTLLAYGYTIEPPSYDFDFEQLAKKSRSTADGGGGGGEGSADAGSASRRDECEQKQFTSRTYRGEKTYAIRTGKWYYEAEIMSLGSIKIGWSSASCAPSLDVAHDTCSYTFDCHAALKWHAGSCEPFGKQCQLGDIVGVMIDMQDKTVGFSLNGELLMDSTGSEVAFESIGAEAEFVPSFALAAGQRVRLNFGQDVESLKYFTNCGLQEGYEPFAVNMTKPLSFWYSNEVPVFENVDASNDSLEIVSNET